MKLEQRLGEEISKIVKASKLQKSIFEYLCKTCGYGTSRDQIELDHTCGECGSDDISVSVNSKDLKLKLNLPRLKDQQPENLNFVYSCGTCGYRNSRNTLEHYTCGECGSDDISVTVNPLI